MATIVYRYTEDAYLVGWANARVAMLHDEDDAKEIARILNIMCVAGCRILTAKDTDGVVFELDGIKRYASPDRLLRLSRIV